jgi:predicted flap endonuclease-1-like 5' DNA nuclease
MGYTFGKVGIWLLLPFILGVVVGWLWWKLKKNTISTASTSVVTDELASLRKERDDLRATNRALTTDVEKYRTEASTSTAQFASLKSSAGSNDAELADLRGKVAGLAGLEAALGAKDDELARLRGDLESHGGAVASKDAEIATLKSQLADVSKTAALVGDRDNAIADLNARLADCQSARAAELADRDSQISALTAQIPARPVLDLDEGTRILGEKVVMDDLKLVEGIGPKIDELFRNDGVTTWRQLSQMSPAAIREMLTRGGSQFQIADPTTWPEQATLLDNGMWDSFKALCDRLTAGRRN